LRACTHETFFLQFQPAATVVHAPEASHPSAQEAIDEVLREMPGSFLCPLSKELMTDPVLLVASALSLSQLQSLLTYTETSTGHPLSDRQTTHLANQVVLRSEIRLFFQRAAANLKVGTHRLRHASGWTGEKTKGLCSIPNRRLGL
jgi:hypothetical protein